MTDFKEQQESLVIEDFSGYISGNPGNRVPPGASLDLGFRQYPYRSSGFVINNYGGMQKASGISFAGQLFGFSDLSQVYGLYYWKGLGFGGTLILATSTGLYRSRAARHSSESPYFLRFEPMFLGMSGVCTPITRTTIPGPSDLYGEFTEYRDRLYYCNGVDWPIRINSMDDLFKRNVGIDGSPMSPVYYPMGVFQPNLADLITLTRSTYPGPRMGAAGVNQRTTATYLVSLQTPYGESPPVLLNPLSGSVDALPLLYVGSVNGAVSLSTFAFQSNWSQIVPFATAINVYRIPTTGSVPQFVGQIPRGMDSFLDNAFDSELGAAPSYGVGLPSNFRLLQTFDDRMFTVGGFGQYNRIGCSEVGYPDQHPILNEVVIGSELGTDTVTRLYDVGGVLYAFRSHSILRLGGSSITNYSFSLTSGVLGCAAPRSLFPWNDGVVFLTTQGLYFFNGLELKPIAPGIMEELSRSSVDWSKAVGAVSKDTYYLSYREDDAEKTSSVAVSSDPNRTYVVNLLTGKVGIVQDFAFSLSTPYGRGEAMVIGAGV
jgi:hypothetical protein